MIINYQTRNQLRTLRQRQQITQLKERLTQERQQGNPIATSILGAVENASNVSVVKQQIVTRVEQSLQKVATSATINNATEKTQVTAFKENLTQLSQAGNSYVTNILSTINNLTQQNAVQSSPQVQQMIEKLASPQLIINEKERKEVIQLKDQLIKEKRTRKSNCYFSSICSRRYK